MSETNLSGKTVFDPCLYFNPYDGTCLREDSLHFKKRCPYVKVETDTCGGSD